MDIKRILCPTDFSDESAHAVELATVVARFYRARIAALHVLSPNFLAAPAPLTSSRVPAVPETELYRLRQETESRFAAAAQAGIDVDALVDVGQPVGCILDRAASLPADMIVIGTHGAGGFEHLMIGSVTEKVLRKAACPVMTVPPRAQVTSQLPFKRLLCAVDFSDASLAALRYASSLAQESNAALTILHVLEWPWEEPPSPVIEGLPAEQGEALADFRRYCETSARARLESVVPSSRQGSRPPDTEVRHGKPYVQILGAALDHQSDLIVVGVQGRRALDLTLFGSTANQVVRRATCPVLTLGRQAD